MSFIYWAYDLFDRVEDSGQPKGTLHSSELHGRVAAKFAAYPQVRLINGAIPAAFAQGAPRSARPRRCSTAWCRGA